MSSYFQGWLILIWGCAWGVENYDIFMPPACRWASSNRLVRLSVRPSVRPSVRLSVRPSVRPSLSVRPSVCPSVRPSVCQVFRVPAITSKLLKRISWNFTVMFRTSRRCVACKIFYRTFKVKVTVHGHLFLVYNRVPAITSKLLKGIPWNFTGMFRTSRRCVACKVPDPSCKVKVTV